MAGGLLFRRRAGIFRGGIRGAFHQGASHGRGGSAPAGLGLALGAGCPSRPGSLPGPRSLHAHALPGQRLFHGGIAGMGGQLAAPVARFQTHLSGRVENRRSGHCAPVRAGGTDGGAHPGRRHGRGGGDAQRQDYPLTAPLPSRTVDPGSAGRGVLSPGRFRPGEPAAGTDGGGRVQESPQRRSGYLANTGFRRGRPTGAGHCHPRPGLPRPGR